MSVQLNHTIVLCSDKARSAAFLADLFGLPAAKAFGPFLVVDTANGVTLAFLEKGGAEMLPQHYAFLVGEDDFDGVFGRIRARGLAFWADPFLRRPGEINHDDGGRGVYFKDPDGHLLEAITRPYGGQ
jgi:catechol 2,3-dioxygenase-like lactoylglutathione lyase family enzyme